jgi:3',5'-cyclic AMP phosphodiesterase CpdA
MRRRKFIEHVGWTGLGVLWTLGSNGLMTACKVGSSKTHKGSATALSFVQISDSHIGFDKAANKHVTETLQKTIAAINALPNQPAFVVHTGDITQLSKPAEFDQAKQILSQLKAPLFTIPGEHDTIGDQGKAYLEAFAAPEKREGLQSWDHSGVHFVSLNNVLGFGVDGKGKVGQSQLDVLKKDLSSQQSDTPIVIFSHIPLYDIYPAWGWATEDSAQVLDLLSNFSAVTVLSGHIHQVIQHTEGNILFQTAASTAFPLPAPGKAEQPAPVKLPPNELLAALGFRTVEFMPNSDPNITQHAL